MMVMVYQIRIGTGNIQQNRENRNTKNFYEFEKQICIPSVQRWAKRCGYDYTLLTESSLTLTEKKFFSCDADVYSSERMKHLFDSDYDYKIYIDSDIFIKSDCSAFPLTEGFSAVSEEITEESFYNRFLIEKKHNKYANAGVFSIDYDTGVKLSNFFESTIANSDNSRIEQAEQDIINSWILQHKFNELDKTWNYMLTENDLVEEQLHTNNFFHFISGAKLIYKEIFRHLNKNFSKNNKKLL